MLSGPEDWFAESPCLNFLQQLGYTWLKPEQNEAARDGLNQVLLRDDLLAALQRINGISLQDAKAVYSDLLNLHDNETWLAVQRGNYSRTVEGESKKKTVRCIDFLNPANNTFTVTNQLTVQAQHTRRPDIVVYVNGIPLVVIEAKSPVSYKDKASQAYEQIRQYQEQIPRLFYSNAFNIITDGQFLLYGATGAKADYWGKWKDPWPRKREEFETDFECGLYSLLEPSRLLDLIAHFIVFETREGTVVKKMCRYQQFRAVNRIVQRVVEGKHRKGLVWHTQGSGKSLTMVMAALKLKTHLTLQSPELESPNLLVLTDRIDLDDQIAATFIACGLPNPTQIKTLGDLRSAVHRETVGMTLLSTIFKFEGSERPVPNSANWILLIDECHRTQEKDLGAYLRKTLPEARFFGFTGTPVKKTDVDTYANFSPAGEAYLDKYGIDDAVADGATVPINYTSRRTDWQVDPERLDILFDQWFAKEPEETIARIKAQGVTMADIVRHPRRIELIAYDMWTHFCAYAKPDGFKGQVVAIDRTAVILYKRAFNDLIAKELVAQGMDPAEAEREVDSYTECVYSSSQDDAKPSDDLWTDGIREDLRRYALPRGTRTETNVKDDFKAADRPPYLLIVCSKLLTGFDAPRESVMYLDNPLKEHNLLQAIARTNRVCGPQKQNGLIVDYIGVTKNLTAALESYRTEDVQNAMRDVEALRQALRAAHAEIRDIIKQYRKGGSKKDALRSEFLALIQALGTEDAWFTFSRKARAFIKAYEVLSPDPEVLKYSEDMKWVAMFLPYATRHFEQREDASLKDYSAKIREMLERHLEVTGISTVIKLRTLTDPDYWEDFDQQDKTKEDLQEAAIRKATELRRELVERVTENPLQFGPFSERVLAIIERMRKGQADFAEELKRLEQLAKELMEETTPKGPLDVRAHGVYKILEAFSANFGAVGGSDGTGNGGESGAASGGINGGLNHLQELAKSIDALYASDESAPPGWHTMEQVKKDLRQSVRRIVVDGGLKQFWKDIPPKVEEYALQKYVKLC
ncbi:type I restriction endonuclease subunit R [Desulfovibrio psychrotolerans]|uniref:Type I restriction enzyme endonuclease subunit n=1 Tax=Desulfovibrio psychrotolerans TaxID=415242 RepID=A0A7J0BQH3_9BACT|nr:type I restriction endonuclease subunit R [Desulfovibrio psychrotolerans]GFM35967.1 DEAD/DEAH box helicase [Desulfovibrio psychrotolerans]